MAASFFQELLTRGGSSLRNGANSFSCSCSSSLSSYDSDWDDDDDNVNDDLRSPSFPNDNENEPSPPKNSNNKEFRLSFKTSLLESNENDADGNVEVSLIVVPSNDFDCNEENIVSSPTTNEDETAIPAYPCEMTTTPKSRSSKRSQVTSKIRNSSRRSLQQKEEVLSHRTTTPKDDRQSSSSSSSPYVFTWSDERRRSSGGSSERNDRTKGSVSSRMMGLSSSRRLLQNGDNDRGSSFQRNSVRLSSNGGGTGSDLGMRRLRQSILESQQQQSNTVIPSEQPYIPLWLSDEIEDEDDDCFPFPNDREGMIQTVVIRSSPSHVPFHPTKHASSECDSPQKNHNNGPTMMLQPSFHDNIAPPPPPPKQSSSPTTTTTTTTTLKLPSPKSVIPSEELTPSSLMYYKQHERLCSLRKDDDDGDDHLKNGSKETESSSFSVCGDDYEMEFRRRCRRQRRWMELEDSSNTKVPSFLIWD